MSSLVVQKTAGLLIVEHRQGGQAGGRDRSPAGPPNCNEPLVHRGARSSAMELFELADVEDFAHLLEIRRRIAGPEIGKDRGALIDVVGGRDAL